MWTISFDNFLLSRVERSNLVAMAPSRESPVGGPSTRLFDHRKLDLTRLSEPSKSMLELTDPTSTGDND